MSKVVTKIQNKILFLMIIVILPIIFTFAVAVYIEVEKSIEESINGQLENSTLSLLNLVKTSAAVSIKNRLRAIAEKNLEIVEHYHKQYLKGNISRERMNSQIRDLLRSQKIGENGYLYTIDSKANVTFHPKKGVYGTNVLEYEFIRKQITRKNGYLEYLWKNPDEEFPRKKALYMSYYKPLDMIISAASYRSEFTDLVDYNDFRKSVLSYKFGKSGYAFVLDSEGI